MIVYILYKNNNQDYYVKTHELIGVFASRALAVEKYEREILDLRMAHRQVPPLDGPSVKDVGDLWYEIEDHKVNGKTK